MGRNLGLEICQKMEIKIDETYHSPHGKFQRFLFPFSGNFPDLIFAPYVLYIYLCYETVCDTNSEPGLPVHRQLV